MIEYYAANAPLPRQLDAADVGSMAAFLASPLAQGVTGTGVTVTLEQRARELWKGWGDYAKHNACDHCGQFVYCRARHVRGPFLCLACFDLSSEADRQLRQKGTR